MTNLISFEEKKKSRCEHSRISVDPDLWKVTCRDCKEELNPVQVLIRMARKEQTARWEVDELNRIVGKLKGKLRVKCRHCGRMTPVK